MGRLVRTVMDASALRCPPPYHSLLARDGKWHGHSGEIPGLNWAGKCSALARCDGRIQGRLWICFECVCVCVCVRACVFEFVELSRPPSPCLFEFVGLSILIDPICFVKEEIGFVDLCEGVRVCVCVCVCPCVCVCVCVCICVWYVCELSNIYAFCVLVYKLI